MDCRSLLIDSAMAFETRILFDDRTLEGPTLATLVPVCIVTHVPVGAVAVGPAGAFNLNLLCPMLVHVLSWFGTPGCPNEEASAVKGAGVARLALRSECTGWCLW